MNKVFCVFLRFREDNEDIESVYFDDNKGAELLKIFDKEEKANNYIEILFNDWKLEHQEEEYTREVWESDFNAFVEERNIE